jgi:phage minor structural protein
LIQIYSNGVLTYDSRLDDYALLALTVTSSVHKAGTATLTMPPGHPAYNAYTSYRSVVEIYRDNVLQFRGRALYPTDDFYNRRTITCEGERNFLHDGVHRPYLYQDGPAAIFEQVVQLYNAQVDTFKQFAVGTVTVTDPNNYIRLESERAESFAATIDALVERCGGYITFTTNSSGQRVINWLADLGYRSQQVIEFGSNLLDFSRSSANTDLATVVIPYGAKDEATGEFVNIASVNGGLDFIQDYDAVALRGVIAQAVYWDDITEPVNLLAKAQQYLAEKRNIVTSLELSAVDLSVLDKSIDAFQVGDLIRVRSKPHGVDDDYLLTERTDDLLDPSRSKVTLGKDELTLTGADAAGDRTAQAGLSKVAQSVKADYGSALNAVVESTRTTMTSLLQQTSDSILLEVEEQYATNDQLTSAVSTSMEQLAESFEFLFNNLQAVVDENDTEARQRFVEIERYIRFENGNIVLGETGNELTLHIEHDRISFLDAGAEVAFFADHKLQVLDGNFLNSLRIGAFEFQRRANGNLSLVKVDQAEDMAVLTDAAGYTLTDADGAVLTTRG